MSDNYPILDNEQQVAPQPLVSRKQGQAVVAAAGLGALVLTQAPPAKADPVADVTTMVTSLGGITTAVIAVIIAAMTARLAIKMVNRLTVKG
jgi:hypothetical protein